MHRSTCKVRLKTKPIPLFPLIALLVTAALFFFLAFNAFLPPQEAEAEWPEWSILDVRLGPRDWEAEHTARALLPSLSCRSPPPSPFSLTGSLHHCISNEVTVKVHATPLSDPWRGFFLHWEAGRHSPPLVNLSLPLSLAQLSDLHLLAEPSFVGLGNASLLRPELRSSREVAGERLTISYALADSIQALREAIAGQLEPELRSLVSLRLQKLVVYGEGDFFVRHRDAYAQEGRLGTVVVLLPTEVPVQGGALRVYRPGNSSWMSGASRQAEQLVWNVSGKVTAIDTSDACKQWTTTGDGSSQVLQWVMFWSDCEHEVEEVISGQRVVLVFGLTVEGRAIYKRNTGISPSWTRRSRSSIPT